MKLLQTPKENAIVGDTQQRLNEGEMLQQCLMPNGHVKQ